MNTVLFAISFVLGFFHSGFASAAGYQADTVKLGTAYRAKLACSCLFVMKLPEDYCKSWSAPPIVKDLFVYKVDRKAMLVKGGIGLTMVKSSQAQYFGEQRGCVLVK
ncbi:MAG TPA: hypothetical protein VIH99_10990 [Bdellovibrionota bacterium]|jgi:hypothetical protein